MFTESYEGTPIRIYGDLNAARPHIKEAGMFFKKMQSLNSALPVWVKHTTRGNADYPIYIRVESINGQNLITIFAEAPEVGVGRQKMKLPQPAQEELLYRPYMVAFGPLEIYDEFGDETVCRPIGILVSQSHSFDGPYRPLRSFSEQEHILQVQGKKGHKPELLGQDDAYEDMFQNGKQYSWLSWSRWGEGQGYLDNPIDPSLGYSEPTNNKVTTWVVDMDGDTIRSPRVIGGGVTYRHPPPSYCHNTLQATIQINGSAFIGSQDHATACIIEPWTLLPGHYANIFTVHNANEAFDGQLAYGIDYCTLPPWIDPTPRVVDCSNWVPYQWPGGPSYGINNVHVTDWTVANYGTTYLDMNGEIYELFSGHHGYIDYETTGDGAPNRPPLGYWDPRNIGRSYGWEPSGPFGVPYTEFPHYYARSTEGTWADWLNLKYWETPYPGYYGFPARYYHCRDYDELPYQYPNIANHSTSLQYYYISENQQILVYALNTRPTSASNLMRTYPCVNDEIRAYNGLVPGPHQRPVGFGGGDSDTGPYSADPEAIIHTAESQQIWLGVCYSGDGWPENWRGNHLTRFDVPAWMNPFYARYNTEVQMPNNEGAGWITARNIGLCKQYKARILPETLTFDY